MSAEKRPVERPARPDRGREERGWRPVGGAQDPKPPKVPSNPGSGSPTAKK